MDNVIESSEPEGTHCSSSSQSVQYVQKVGKKKYRNIRCAYCYVYKSPSDNRMFFHFPANAEMCKKWVALCNRPYLQNKSVSQLHKSYKICSDHFDKSDFKSSKMRYLNPEACPRFHSMEVDVTNLSDENSQNLISNMKQSLNEKINSYLESSDMLYSDDNSTLPIPILGNNLTSTPKRKNEEVLSSVSFKRRKILSVSAIENNATDLDTGCRNKTRVITPKTKKIKKLSTKLHFLKKRLDKSKSSETNSILLKIRSMVSPVVFRFISSQLKTSGISPYARRWTAEDKNFALQIYLASPRAYNVLSKHFCFPSKRTLQNSISGIDVKAGFNEPILAALKILCGNMKPEEKLCTISFDEIKLKHCVSYYMKSDIIVGFENYGTAEHKSTKLATHALVFMVRGVCKKWKQVFGAFLSAETTASSTMKLLVVEAIQRLFDAGLEPVSIICDMGSKNQKLFTSELFITEDKPYFFVQDKKIYALYDPPHLLKCLRNNFFKYNVKFNENKIAKWEHIVWLYNFDVNKPYRIIAKLKKEHIELKGFSKMSVKRAAQVLSHSVAAALYTIASLGGIESCASSTSEFCKTVNDLFDSVNSRVLMHKKIPLLSAVTKTSLHLNKWKEFKSFIKTIAFDTKDKKINFPSLSGWLITLSAFIQMIPELHEKIDFVLMNRFNQDALENFFSMVRRKGGNNDNPTPLDFFYRLRLLLAESIVNFHSNSNCEPDEDNPLVPISIINIPSYSFSNTFKNLIVDETVMADIDLAFSKLNTHGIDDPFLQNPAAFVAGYLARRILNAPSSSCCGCNKLLTQNKTLNQSTIFLHFKEYEWVKKGLKYPSENFIFIISQFGILFEDFFKENLSKPGIAAKTIKCLQEVEHRWFNCPQHAEISWNWMIQLYTKMMLCNKVKRLSDDLKNTKTDQKKLKKMQKN